MIRPGVINDLWLLPAITVASVHAFFDGQHSITVGRGRYDEPVPIPMASREVVDEAIRSAVRASF